MQNMSISITTQVIMSHKLHELQNLLFCRTKFLTRGYKQIYKCLKVFDNKISSKSDKYEINYQSHDA